MVNPAGLELRHLRLVQAVQAAGSLTAAAERLHLTQSAASHQMKALEDLLGLAVLDRAARPAGLTVAGRRLLALAERLLPEVDAARRDLAKLADGDAGELRVAVECHTCFDWLMPAMDAYREAWPLVELDLVGGFHADPAALLTGNAADLVVVSDAPARPGVAYAPLFAYEIVALLPPGHALAAKKHLAPADFADQTLIVYPVPPERLDFVRRVLAPAGVHPLRREAELTVAILQLVASRRGVAALPAWAVAPYLERGYVVARPIGAHGLWAELHAAARSADLARAYVADFVDTLKTTSFARLPGVRTATGG